MKPKVLVIDDDAVIRKQLYWSLCEDYDVLTAEDLPSALRHAVTYEPTVSLLDLHLPPTLDAPAVGLRILEQLKMQCPGAKVFVVSSALCAELRAACLARGADGFFNKPLDMAGLLTMLRHATFARQLAAA